MPQIIRTDQISRLGLASTPIAVAFLDQPPDGLSRVDKVAAAGCGYWKEASAGRAFYTTADDQTGCAVGAFTHGVTMTLQLNEELQGLVGTMIELKYLKSEEVAGIPHREQPARIVAYAPLDSATFEPDVVIFRGNVRQIMLLTEAARAAGVYDSGTLMGRPACAVIPQAISSARASASTACIGNRVYTDLGDDELYLAIPGSSVGAVLEQIGAIIDANEALERFHRDRLRAAAASPRVPAGGV
jgi:uncharacterized protein (DUF169 family)